MKTKTVTLMTGELLGWVSTPLNPSLFSPPSQSGVWLRRVNGNIPYLFLLSGWYCDFSGSSVTPPHSIFRTHRCSSASLNNQDSMEG